MDAVIDSYRNTLISRLNDKQKDGVIVTHQRLDENDLSGYLLRTSDAWDCLILPAIAVTHERVEIGNGKIHERAEGEVLHPEREPRELLDDLRKTMGSAMFAAQYQQHPVPAGDGFIKWKWFKRYSNLPQDGYPGLIVQSWDTATEIGERNSYSVCTTWLYQEGSCYLIGVFRDRLEFPGLKNMVKALADQHNADLVLIEESTPSKPLIQDLQGERYRNIVAMRPEGSKKLRMMATSLMIECGLVFLPEDAPWMAEFHRECVRFPNGKHDDQVDSLSQFLTWVRGRKTEERDKQWVTEMSAVLDSETKPRNAYEEVMRLARRGKKKYDDEDES